MNWNMKMKGGENMKTEKNKENQFQIIGVLVAIIAVAIGAIIGYNTSMIYGSIIALIGFCNGCILSAIGKIINLLEKWKMESKLEIERKKLNEYVIMYGMSDSRTIEQSKIVDKLSLINQLKTKNKNE